MQRFGKILLDDTRIFQDVEVKEIFPLPKFGKFIRSEKLSKWFNYIDKYIIFPKRLKKVIKINSEKIRIVHIIDQSNAPYIKTIKYVSSAKCLVTCHDLIAVRTAQCEFPFAPKTSPSGKKLQNWIRSTLSYADYYACDSNETKKDLNRIIPSSLLKSKVIHLGTELNAIKDSKSNHKKYNFSSLARKERYILHVGSAAWYKNRMAVFEAFQYACRKTNLKNFKLVLVGPPPQEHELSPKSKIFIKQNLKNIITIQNACEQTLRELYENAAFLIFPSHIEGFGWPPLEAASIGCPVITSKTGAIHELLGDYPKYVEPNNQDSINFAVTETLRNKEIFKYDISLPSNENFKIEYNEIYQSLLTIH
jgi:glycosyltransferase involved in cell wall biosynthesis